MANFLVQTLINGLTGRSKGLSSVPSGGGGWHPILESFSGAWQRNIEIDREGVLSNPYVFRCQSMISRDIAKLRVKLVRNKDGIWSEDIRSIPKAAVLHKPNGFQNRNQFFECWFLSKLARGNTYVLKRRGTGGNVTALYVLDPQRVQVLVSDSGEVFYQVSSDNLSGVKLDVTFPASEIIHDRWNCLFHPLVGLSPIFANALTATQYQKISESAAKFFNNQSRPGGILTAPGKISDDTAKRLKSVFDTNYTGDNAGKVAVVGDGLKFEPLTVHATDSQLVEQLKWTAETIATTYGVPLYKVGLGPMPTANNTQALNIEYYSQALQGLIEDAESCLDEGLGFDGKTIGTEFETDNLWRLDSLTQMEVVERSKSVLTLDERRKRLDHGPIDGGATVYLQQQDHSIQAIAARDRQLIAQADAPAVVPPAPVPADPTNEAEQRAFFAETLLSMRKALEPVA